MRKDKMRKCSLKNCNNKHYGIDFCLKHHTRLKRHGNPLYQSRKEPKFGTLKERFDKSYIVNAQTNCWEWIGSFNRQGYPLIQFNDENKKRINIRGNRLSYKLYKGKIVDKLYVCHSCDNIKCVNPDHLWLGTASDNMKDCVNKNRHPVAIKGKRPEPMKWHSLEEHSLSKLSNNSVLIIKNELSKGILGKELAKRFNVSLATISAINVGKRWNSLGDI